MKKYLVWLLGIFAPLAIAGAAEERGAPASAADAKPRRLVFAHYMLCFTNSIEFCQEEIRIAQRHGIDGFALDFGGWGEVKDGVFTPGTYTQSAERMYEAAKRLNTGFLLMPTPEYSVQPMAPQVADVVKRFYQHPNQFRHQGRMVMCAYLLDFGADFIAQMKKEGYDLLYVPFLGNGKHEMNLSVESALRLFREHPYIDGLFRFVCDDSVEGMMRHNSNACRAARLLDKIYMAGVAPTYASANIRDFQGLRGYASLWESIIRDGADWVQIITWNDYNEDTNLMHYKWKRQWDKPAYNRDGAFLDITAYYA
ncbi:MAG: endo-1,3-alpha-glucanase family glycosylhydrolase, partial [Planctomycetota bacterium]|nr:endo-1,3-alpha-glucanase family glycosylhydrolase [Planctomycetota bacterium]